MTMAFREKLNAFFNINMHFIPFRDTIRQELHKMEEKYDSVSVYELRRMKY